jgi:hypothetical protein
MQGGPWAALLAVIMAVSFLFWRGIFVTGAQVDRTVAGYKDSLDRTEKELAFWRAAAEKKDTVIERQAEQLHKLMTYSALGTHALEAIQEEAGKRGLDA